MDADGLSPATVTGVLRGAQQRNPDSLYFLGLLRLYGHGGLAEDHTKAAGTILEVVLLLPQIGLLLSLRRCVSLSEPMRNHDKT